MADDISGYGLSVIIVATETFPVAGFTITEFADDADPITFEDITTGEVAMGLNGDLVSWTTPNPIVCSVSVIPDSDDDINLSILLEANRSGKGKRAILDRIDLTRALPGSTPVIFTNGKITGGPSSTSVLQSGRKQSKTYTFAFENKVGVS